MKYGKFDVINSIAKYGGIKKVDAAEQLENVVGGIKALLQDSGDVVNIKNFLRLEKRVKAARYYNNPKGNEKIWKEETEEVKATAKF